MSLQKNVIANFIGQGWTALMGLAFVPLYIQYLGTEAYGLIGIFSLLQAWLMLLDVGMTPALSREMARFSGGAQNAQSIRNLLRSVEVIGVSLAALVALTIWGLSGWLASNWLKVEKLPIDDVAQAFVIMGIVAGLRFIENIYRSSIIGLQKQVVLNVVSSVMATLRSVGAIGVLVWIAPSINAFFVWQGVVSVITAAIFIIFLYRDLPASEQRSQFSWSAITSIWRFAAGIALITFLSFLLMQTDKILLSRFLSLEQFGYYALAALLANSLNMIVGPIDLAFFPRFTSQVSQSDRSALISTFHLGSQLITVFVGSAAIVLILFGEVVLSLWTQNVELAKNIAPLLAVLSLGTLFNCFMHMPYQLQLAHGWTRLTIIVNIIAVILLVPAIFWVAPKYGALGV
ncbi:MAG TPA: oligosaccharide flippase family protein, partial [Methylotenera sp.]|nr:oligosaccharide flippase family protein [Methylotenera sp.]